jgi:ligand-binding SRPBCC domain-containing protein
MRLTLSTSVEQNHLEVKAGFDEHLFKKLAPPFPPVKVSQFDGCVTGDTVALELNFLLFKQQWISKITDDGTDDQEFFFVDEGVKLPFFLKKWSHRHRVIAQKSGSIIRDEIEFEGPFKWMNYLLFPALWVQFAYRKPIYRKIFKRSA